jgi:aminoglycoside phosphotransferase (APT) family kinase protein
MIAFNACLWVEADTHSRTARWLKMDISGKNLSKVSDNLLYFLREETGDTNLDYETAPSQIQGGNETSIFRFQLKRVHSSLSRPLVLRVFNKSNLPKHAIMESVVHNSLADQGFPVPYVHFSCIDHKYIGYQFLIMDFLPGDILPLIFEQDTPTVLGKTHAELHNADSTQLSKDMIMEGFGGKQYSVEGWLDQLRKASERLPWLEEIVLWLIENKPSECRHPSICHRDFHPGNLLARNFEITAILDWSCCRIGDPVMDVASTLVILNAATKHIIRSIDVEVETRKYLEAYTRKRDLDERLLEYYQLLGCAIFLFAGANGISIWTQAPILNELIKIIYDFSKIQVRIPR